jgi:hypothetical protein
LLSSFALGSCTTTDTLTVEGEYVDYHYSPTLEPCAGTPDYLDGFPAFLEESLGVDLPPGSNLEYRWLDSDSFERESRLDEVTGISYGTTALSRTPALTHELVHTAMASLGGISGNTFFDEGVAYAYTPVALGVAPRLLPGDYIDIQEVDLMAEVVNPNAEYAVAGSFVGFMLYRHGPEKMLDFLRRLGPRLSLPGIKLIFLDVYGVSLESELTRFKGSTAKGICAEDGFAILPYECEQESVGSFSGVPWEYTWEAECGDEKSYGGAGGEGNSQIETAFTINIEASGVYTVELIEPGPASASTDMRVVALMGPCTPCPFVQDARVDNATPARSVELASGRYYVRLSVPWGDVRETGIRLY